jgi:hypothetical protein
LVYGCWFLVASCWYLALGAESIRMLGCLVLGTRNLEPFSGAGNGLYASLGLKEFRVRGLENLKPETWNLKLGAGNWPLATGCLVMGCQGVRVLWN